MLQAQLDRFEALLADLLEISRFDAGAAVLEAEPTDLRGSSRGASSRPIEPLAERRGSELVAGRARPCPASPRCDAPADRADPAQPGRQRHRARRGPTRSTSRVAADDEAVAVAVRDHGVGLRAGRGGAWSSTGSGGPTRPGRAPPAAPGSACPSRWRTPTCTAAGCRRGASRATAASSGSPCRDGPGVELERSPDPAGAAATPRRRRRPWRSAQPYRTVRTRGGRCLAAAPAAALLPALRRWSLLAGCASIPTAGPVRAGATSGPSGRVVVPAIGQPPTRGAGPEDIVRGFLQASADFVERPRGRAALPRAAARRRWRPSDRHVVYDRVKARSPWSRREPGGRGGRRRGRRHRRGGRYRRAPPDGTASVRARSA